MKAVSFESLFKSNKTWSSQIKWICLLPIWIVIIITNLFNFGKAKHYVKSVRIRIKSGPYSGPEKYGPE